MTTFSSFDQINIQGFITQVELDNYRPFVVFRDINAYLSDRAATRNPSYHEIIEGHKPRKFFLDIDWDVKKTPDNDKYFEGELCKIRRIIKDTFTELFNLEVLNSDIAELRSDGKKRKYSANLIVMKYAVPNQNAFTHIGSDILDKYDGIAGFIDPQQIKSKGKFANRLVNCTKLNEFRFKRFVKSVHQKDYSERELIIGNVDKLDVIEYSKYKSVSRSNVSITDEMVKTIVNKYQFVWGDNFEYSKHDHNYITMSRISPSYCTCCDRTHDRVGIYIVCLENGVIIKCFQDKDGKALHVDIDEEEEYIEAKPREPKAIVAGYVPDNTGITEFNPDISKFKHSTQLKELGIGPEAFPKDARVKLVMAEMKMGKTTNFIKTLKDVQHDTRIVFISFRRTFSFESSKKYKDFELYSDIPEKSISLIKHPRLIIQLESLHRIELGSKADIIIMDEVESIWTQFDSGNFVDLMGCINIFEYLLKWSQEIIAMDANLSNRTLRLFEYLIPGYESESSIYINKYNPSQEIKTYTTNNIPRWIGKLSRLIVDKKNVMIMTNTLKEAKKLNKYVQTLTNNVMLYSSETLESVKSKHFRDVNKYWKDYQVVICTPTISAGVSFEESHFDVVMGYFIDKSCDVQTCQQMIGRVREIRGKDITLCFNDVNTVKYTTDIDEIAIQLETRRQELVSYDSSNIGYLNFYIDDDGDIVYRKTLDYWLILYGIAYRNTSRCGFEHLYKRIIRNKGGSVARLASHESDNKYSLDYKKSNGEYDEQVVKEINTAKNIDNADYEKIKNLRINMHDVEYEQVVEYNKYRMMKSLQNSPSDLRLGQIKEFYKNFENLNRLDRTREICQYSADGWETALDKLHESDKKKSANNVDIHRWTKHSRQHRALYELMREYPGLTVPPIDELFTSMTKIPDMNPKDKPEYLEKLKKYLGEFYNANIDTQRSPNAILSDIICSFYILSKSSVNSHSLILGSQGIAFNNMQEYYHRSAHTKLATVKKHNRIVVHMQNSKIMM